MELFLLSFAPWDISEFWKGVILLGLGAGASFWWWYRSLKHSRTIADVPTSKVHSAAQGYVELRGRQFPGRELPLSAPLTDRECTWWHYWINKKTDDDWKTVARQTSSHLIRLEDDTGEVLVDPRGAEVHPAVTTVWYGNRRRPDTDPDSGGDPARSRYSYHEQIMRPGEPLYAIGHFETSGGGLDPSEQHRRVVELLREWKEDPDELVERFDADADGSVDLQEWERARAEAERVIERQVAKGAAQSPVNLLLPPPDGRPFVLSLHPQEELEGHFRRDAIGALVLFVILAGLLAALLASELGGG